MNDRPAPDDSSKRKVGKYLRAAVSIGVLSWLAWRMDWAKLANAFAHLRLELWAAAVILYLATQVVSGWRWQLLARPLGFDGSVWKFTSLYFVGMFFNLLLPTSVGGDVVRAWYLDNRPGRRLPAMLSVLVDRASGLMLLILIACGAVLVSAWRGAPLDGLVRLGNCGLRLRRPCDVADHCEVQIALHAATHIDRVLRDLPAFSTVDPGHEPAVLFRTRRQRCSRLAVGTRIGRAGTRRLLLGARPNGLRDHVAPHQHERHGHSRREHGVIPGAVWRPPGHCSLPGDLVVLGVHDRECGRRLLVSGRLVSTTQIGRLE